MPAGVISESNMVTSLVIPKALRAEVQQHCDRTGAKFGSLVRMLIIQYMEKQHDAQHAQEEHAAA